MSTRSFARTALGITLLLALPITALADDKFAATGGEFLVNTVTTFSQFRPDIASAAGGEFIVVWDSSSPGIDTSSNGIRGQRFASDGSKLGAEFEINTFTTGRQDRAAVAASAAGFVVVWKSDGSVGTDADSDSVQGQRYASDGSTLGGQFQVNTFTTGVQALPAVAMAPGGEFVVVWESSGIGDNIQGQRFASDGSALGGEFTVNAYVTASQFNPAITMDAAGNFVVAWDSYGSPGTDNSGNSVQVQRFASDGLALGGQFQVNTYTTVYQENADIALAPNGDFVVVWHSDAAASDASNKSVHGQRYASDGSAVGGEFQINTYTTEDQSDPVVAIGPSGDFVVAWQSGDLFGMGPDGDYSSVQAQRYASDGSAIGGEFQVNTYTTTSQDVPAIIATAEQIVMVWESYNGPPADDFAPILGQRFVFEADLSITKDDGVDAADPGGTLTYTIVASNAGPDPAMNAIVVDEFPADLDCSWMSMVTGGTTGNTPSSGGDIIDTLTMPVGSTVTYTVTCDIDSEANATLINVATITSSLSDPDPSNNLARDYTAVPPDLFTDGFETGNTTAWSNSVQ